MIKDKLDELDELSAKLEETAKEAIMDYLEGLEIYLWDLSKSQSERALGLALVNDAIGDHETDVEFYEWQGVRLHHWRWGATGAPASLLEITQGYEMGGRRVAYLLQVTHRPTGGTGRAAILCEDIAAVRNELVQEELDGCALFRLSSSEVFRDPAKCAREVLDFARNQADGGITARLRRKEAGGE